jgi:hypothetical protein
VLAVQVTQELLIGHKEITMAHFAQIDENNKVIQVLVVDNAHENRGAEYLADDLGLGGTWVQTSYNAKIRGKFAQAGDTYNSDDDLFIPAKPEECETWTFNKKTMSWESPIPLPANIDGFRPKWDKETQTWVADTNWFWNKEEKTFKPVVE